MSVGPLKYVTVNGLEFAYYEVGEGPLVLCIHGYPDTADTWESTMPVLADAGYRVVAPFTRGYAPSGIPIDGSYSGLELGNDIVGLVDALGADTATVVGHDWGAFATYVAANVAPERIDKIVTVAIPHPRVIKLSFGGLWRARHFVTYQFRSLAIRSLKRNDFAAIDRIYKRWSPNWDPSAEDLAAVKMSLARPGVTEAALGYYWAWRDGLRNKDLQKVYTAKTSVPALCIVGDADGALDLTAMPHSPKAFTGSYSYEVMSGLGHFPHREDPDAFNALVLEFLGSD